MTVRNHRQVFHRYLLASIALIAFAGCSTRRSEVPGTYITDDGTIEVRQDGNFEVRVHGALTSAGRWKLTSHFLDTGLELDSATSADEYRLTRQQGYLCLEVRPDLSYWCRSD